MSKPALAGPFGRSGITGAWARAAAVKIDPKLYRHNIALLLTVSVGLDAG
jgi:hypothetical protein